VFDLTDMAANSAGAILASVLALVVLRALDRREAPRP
jgi:hypothetical protein